MANKTITQLDAAQSLNDNMVVPVELNGNTYKASLGQIRAYCLPTGSITITENGTYNVANYSEAVVNVPTAPTKKYNLLDRVTDDSNNEIGTVSGFFTDANDVEYAVVCLDKSTWANGQWASTDNEVTGLPIYNQTTRGPWKSTETATFNTQKILDYCASMGATSTACTHCRAYSYTIDGVVYYGQLPNMIELCDICKNITINVAGSPNILSSNQTNTPYVWGNLSTGSMSTLNRTYGGFVIPVLEIPL